MARRDLTAISSFSLPDLGGAGSAPGTDLESAYRDGFARLRQVALRVTRDAAAADDVVQGAFEKALRYRGRFRGEAKASTWLHRIVVNEALMWLRGEKRRAAKEARLADALACEAPQGSLPPLDALLARERDVQVRAALGVLRPEDADLLAHSVEERGYERWAQRMGMKRTAAKTRAFRARRTLRAALEAEDA
jgi:RNA polymerase sigma-70 factor (ECF subfamily)